LQKITKQNCEYKKPSKYTTFYQKAAHNTLVTLKAVDRKSAKNTVKSSSESQIKKIKLKHQNLPFHVLSFTSLKKKYDFDVDSKMKKRKIWLSFFHEEKPVKLSSLGLTSRLEMCHLPFMSFIHRVIR